MLSDHIATGKMRRPRAGHAARESMLALGLALALALLATCATVLLPSAASATPTGAISGTVTKAVGGEPIAHTEACAKVSAGESSVGCAETGANGEYTISGLPPGEYRVRFNGQIGPVHRDYASQWYNGVLSFSAATPVEVEASKTRTEVNASLQLAGTLHGTVTNSEGAPVQSVVFLWEEPEPGVYEGGEFFDADAEGKYTLAGVGENKAYVEFSGYDCAVVEEGCPPVFARQFYDHASTLESATPLLLKPGESKEVDAVMVENGHISGRVYSAAIEHEPIAGALVCSRPQGEPLGAQRCDIANGNGEYTITALPSGPYAVEFSGEVCPGKKVCHSAYGKQFYSGKEAFAEAVPVSVNVATTTAGIDAALFELNPLKPLNTTPPVLSGNAALGGSLSCAPGTWDDKPTKLEYSWLRDGTPIPGQASGGYVVTSLDRGHAISCAVTASNAAGSASASSNSVTVLALWTGPPLFGCAATVAHTARVHKGYAAAVLHFARTFCGGTLTLTARVRERRSSSHHGKHARRVRRVVVGTADFPLASRAEETVQIRLNAAGRRLLRESGKRGLSVQVSGDHVQPGALELVSATGNGRGA